MHSDCRRWGGGAGAHSAWAEAQLHLLGSLAPGSPLKRGDVCVLGPSRDYMSRGRAQPSTSPPAVGSGGPQMSPSGRKGRKTNVGLSGVRATCVPGVIVTIVTSNLL